MDTYKRWTRDVCIGIILDVRGNEVLEDPKLAGSQQYKNLCSKMIKLVVNALSSTSEFKLVDEGLDDLSKKIKEMRLQEKTMVNGEGNISSLTREYVTQANGFKKWPDWVKET